MRLRGFGGPLPLREPDHAARTPSRNFSTSAFRCRLSLDKAWAEANIRLDFIAGLARALRRVADIDGDIVGPLAAAERFERWFASRRAAVRPPPRSSLRSR